MTFEPRLVLVVCTIALLAPVAASAQASELEKALRSLVGAPTGQAQGAQNVSAIPDQFQGSWCHEDNEDACAEGYTTDVSDRRVSVEVSGVNFKSGTLQGDRLTFTGESCADAICEEGVVEVQLELKAGRLSYTTGDEAGEPQWLRRWSRENGFE